MAGPFGLATAPTEPAAAAETFDAGNIIADSVFYNPATMTAAEIQAFLVAKVPTCRVGYTCLKDFVQPTYDIPASAYCKAYKGWAGQRAADIIFDVAQACNLNPQAMLVLLQKEQGLVTDTWPVDRQYRSATGYGCPDTPAGCDSKFYGFFNQVYQAARRFQVYKAEPGSYLHRPFVSNNVRFHPEVACGSAPVYISNYATAGLYNYTPYQPNRAALAAGLGYGDACSAYGNRNFFTYFVSWFKSTQGIVKGAIGDAWQNVYGGSTGVLGHPKDYEVCGLVGSGCYQDFQKGKIYWNPTTGAHAVKGPILADYANSGWEGGPLGYPTGSEICGIGDGGCYQNFQKGQIHWSSATGAHYTATAMNAAWGALGWEGGPLGYPTSDPACGLAGGGCFQYFRGGEMHWSPATGAHYTNGVIRDTWGTLGWETGKLGYPTTDPACTADGWCSQTFERGQVFLDPAKRAFTLQGGIWTGFTRAGGATALGYPVTAQNCGLTGGGCYQYFEKSQIHWSPKTGAYPTSGALRSAWGSYGWEKGKLGYPTGDPQCGTDGRCAQPFQGGVLYASADAAFVTGGGIGAAYTRAGAQNGSLGFPTSNEVCGIRGGGCYQYFEKGQIHWSPTTGGFATQGGVRTAWGTTGWENGSVGYPTSDPNCTLRAGGCVQFFQTGAIYTTAAGSFPSYGGIRGFWGTLGWENGSLGYPTSGEQCNASRSECTQTFEKGAIVWTAATGPRVR